MKKVTDEMLEQIRELYWDKKLTMKQVGEILGLSDKGVEYQLKKHFGTRSRSESLKGKKVTEKVRETARKLGKSQVGSKNPRWKGGVRRGKYIAIRVPDHPFASSNGYVMEHRLVVEKKLGRYLTPDEDVHHINHKKTDNRPENLMVISKSEHARLHGLERIKNGTHNCYKDVTREQMLTVITNSNSVTEMHDKLGISRKTFYIKLKKLGLENIYTELRKNA